MIQAFKRIADVALVPRNDAPNADEQVRWLEAFRAYISRNSPHLLWRVLFAAAPDSASLFDKIADNDKLQDASELPILFTKISAYNADAMGVMTRCITHLLKFRIVQCLSADSSYALVYPYRFKSLGKSSIEPRQ